MPCYANTLCEYCGLSILPKYTLIGYLLNKCNAFDYFGYKNGSIEKELTYSDTIENLKIQDIKFLKLNKENLLWLFDCIGINQKNNSIVSLVDEFHGLNGRYITKNVKNITNSTDYKFYHKRCFEIGDTYVFSDDYFSQNTLWYKIFEDNLQNFLIKNE